MFFHIEKSQIDEIGFKTEVFGGKQNSLVQ